VASAQPGLAGGEEFEEFVAAAFASQHPPGARAQHMVVFLAKPADPVRPG
jgi:hypothetical protein